MVRFFPLALHTVSALLYVTRYFPLLLRIKFTPKVLARRNETTLVSSGKDQVNDYNQVMSSRLAVFYAIALETLHRAFATPGKGVHLDLAPGPGHFTLLLNKTLRLEKTIGIDRSLPMIAVANENAAKLQMESKVSFAEGDATDLKDYKSESADLVTMTFASHHLPSHGDLSKALAEMDRVVKPGGLIAIVDLIRLPGESITEDFVKLAGRDYIKKGWSAFYNDFYQSMFAAWTTDETLAAVPLNSKRQWILLTNGGVPTLQILLGYPKDQRSAFVRRTPPWRFAPPFLPLDLIPEWWLAKIFQLMGKRLPVGPLRP